ncbi:uncharacterized protein isoform X2 [Rhodnius prolixus]|uniref:uncharacterized protein isoform X2 n=1 Tax=Rhodnius prolixus TaxID=13249 RepID=UPI003D18874E
METANEKDSVNETITDDDIQDKVENQIEALLAEIVELKSERQKCQEEFGAQRGKMKELFLQKEEEHLKLQEEIKRLRLELDDARSQLTVTGLDLEANQAERIKSEDELTSLQQLVTATIEESSRLEEEVLTLRQRVADLEKELTLPRGSGTGGHGPMYTETAHSPGAGEGSMLNLTKPGTMFTSLARLPAKLVSQLGATDQPFHHHQQQMVDDTGMKKAKEDAEMLRSLVVPLEEEIDVLKKKLRETDEQLQRYQAQEEKIREAEKKTAKLIDLSQSSGESHSEPSQNISIDESVASSVGGACIESSHPVGYQKSMVCDMCVNYEAQLVAAQDKCAELERQVGILERYKDELAKETVLNKQLESKWQESRDQHKNEVTDLQEKMKISEDALKHLKQTYIKTCEDIKNKFSKLTEERKQTEDKLNRLQAENEDLIGKYNAHSYALQNEEINLPDNVERLQEMWLTQREQLIKAKVGQERANENVKSLECLCAEKQEKQDQLQATIEKLEEDLFRKESSLHKEHSALIKSEQEKEALNQQISTLNVQIHSLKQAKKKLESSECELRTRLTSLQTGLENGEAVQKDFVLLSQSLQRELERLRGQNTTLRWEHEEDVNECRGCEQPFKSASKGKYNCRHCGRIFCLSCLGHKITSGPAQRESRVCQVCHTLLNSETAPYFSTTSAVHPPHHHQDNK